MQMDYQNAIDYVVSHPDVILQKAKKSGYICPCCGSGSGQHGTGITESKKFKNRFTCFANDCFSGANVFGIVAAKEKLNKHDAFIRTLQIYGITLDKVNSKFTDTKPLAAPPPKEQIAPISEIPVSIIMDDMGRSQQEQDTTYYLSNRGLSEATQKHFGCGFIKSWYTPSIRPKIASGELHIASSPRVIIPTSGHSYLARDIRPKETLNDYEKGYTKMKVGSGHEFNWHILKKAKGIVFLPEAEIDAMSCYEAGQKQSLGLGSTAYVNHFLDYLKEQHPPDNVIFAIVLDDDTAGRTATEKLIAGIKEQGYMAVDAADVLLPGTKDPNESLIKDSKAFREALNKKAKNLAKLQKKESARGCR